MPEFRPTRMSLKTARRLAVAKQHLTGKRPSRPGPGSIMGLMEDIRYLQLDPTAAVAPSHLLVLWSRLGPFRESDLDTLMWKERKLFEYWAHRASIVLTEDYPLYAPRMRRFYEGNGLWDVRVREWMNQNPRLREYVLGELKARGPLPLREFEDKSGEAWHRARRKWGLRPSAWSTGRSVSRMIEFLFHDGSIMVAGRQGRQKLWNLSERCLPEWTPRTALAEGEVEYQGAQLSLKALGVATPKQVSNHFLIGRYPKLRSTFASLLSNGKVAPVELEDENKGKGRFFIHADDIPLAAHLEKGDWEPKTTLLSPFDNLVADRDRTQMFFDFFDRIEIYMPKAQRKHGFFVLPILDGDRLVGRVDPTMDREREELTLNAVYSEQAAPDGRAISQRIAEAIQDLGEFLGAKRVIYGRKLPEGWKSWLR